ncbi:hypothetical protein BEP19_13765 [Ammoniphilus oxalaticus]|uniref:Uncharacterized protein n=1 Tax=Ammoniphilus oxalaticus TaxID=66863 RepID=A0A419SED0_9BACL|nr:hypothetical protein [Ammoniphilus oxalaticus]RKD21696.1 hypothetical protein BEP19_13765 [Ammoniphilus oxalaticus]
MGALSQEQLMERCVAGERIVRCPNCQRVNVGQVAPKYFYCSDCFIEMKLGKTIEFFELDENGELACLNDIFYS